MQFGVIVPAPQHSSTSASQFTPYVLPSTPGQLYGPGAAVTGAGVGSEAGVGASVTGGQ
jgi:hypothetical protein